MERQIMGQGAILPVQRMKDGTADISPADIFARAEGVDTATPDVLRQLTVYESELWTLTSLKNNYERVRKSLETPIPRSYIISPAVIAEKPSWPPRLLIAFAAVIAYVIIMVFIRIVRMD